MRAAARKPTFSCAPCVFSAHHRRLSAPHITTNHPGATGIGVRNFGLGTRYSFRENTGVGVGVGEFRKNTPTSTEREHHPDARRRAHSRRRARTTHPYILTCRQTRGSSTRALVVVVLGVGGLVVAVGLDKDMVTGERTGERALTLARSPPREVVPERAGTSPAGSHSTWA